MANQTYFVAIPFGKTDDGFTGGQPVECGNANSAVNRARSMSTKPGNSGALAFKRSGNPNIGEFKDGEILATFGDVPDDLSEM
jgi:hypothetical protein